MSELNEIDRENFELALFSLNNFAEELSPTYESIREGLNGELGTLATQEGIAASRRNVDLVNAIVNSLDLGVSINTGGNYVDHIECPDLASARVIQRSVIWYSNTGSTGSEPVAIIGKRLRDKGKKTELLFRSVRPVDRKPDEDSRIPLTGPFSMTIKTKKALKLENAMESAIGRPFTEGEFGGVYAPKEGHFKIRPYSPGCKRLYGRDAWDGVYPKTDLTYGIASRDLLDFEVYDYFNQLATWFGKAEEVGQILESTVDGLQLQDKKPQQ
jgi:hypothetical protein